MTKGEAQRSRWIFYEAVFIGSRKPWNGGGIRMTKEIIKGGDRLWNLRWDKVEKDHPEFRGKAAVFSYATKIVHPKTLSFISGAIRDRMDFLSERETCLSR
jgi:hypothetical protein